MAAKGSVKPTANPRTGHCRALRLYPLGGLCEHCREAPAADRHHKDGNPLNNDRANVELLCRRCHMIADGRLPRFRDAKGGRGRKQPAKPCASCGELAKPLRRGRCARCYKREVPSAKSCRVCGAPVSGLGYCEKHYQRFKKWGDPLLVKTNQYTPVRRVG